MLTVTMAHTGELFIESAENRYSLKKWMHVATSKGQDDRWLVVIEEALLDEVGKHIGVFLDDNFQSLYSANHTDFIKIAVHTEVVNTIVKSVRNGITDKLQGRGVTGFDISDSPFLEEK